MAKNDAASPQHQSTQSVFVVQANSISCSHLTTCWCLIIWQHSWGMGFWGAPPSKGWPRSQRQSYSEAWEYWAKLILQPIYHLGKLSPRSHTWFKCNNRGKVKCRAFCSKMVAEFSLCLPVRQYHTVTGECCKIFWAVKKFQGSKKDMPFLLLGQIFKYSCILSLDYIPICKKHKDSPKVFFSMS